MTWVEILVGIWGVSTLVVASFYFSALREQRKSGGS